MQQIINPKRRDLWLTWMKEIPWLKKTKGTLTARRAWGNQEKVPGDEGMLIDVSE